MGWRRVYKKARRRAGKTAPGRWLKRVLKEHRERERTPREARQREKVGVFIVSEKNWPSMNARFFYQEWLDWAAEKDPRLFAQIKATHLPAQLPKSTAVFHAWVQDPVRERNAALFEELGELEEAARLTGTDIIHPAQALSNSLREVQFDRLTRAGLKTPRVVAVDDVFAREIGGLSLPVVVRKSWGHQKGMVRLDTQDDVQRWFAEASPDLAGWVATEYIDVQCADGNYRKYRYILFGEHGVCRHLIISPHWEVRPSGRVLTDQTIAEELDFVNGHCEAHEILDAARRELELDIAAFDYSFDRDGEMIVWEVNPYPDLSTPGGRPGEYLAGSVVRTNEALAALYHERIGAARSWRNQLARALKRMPKPRYSRTS